MLPKTLTTPRTLLKNWANLSVTQPLSHPVCSNGPEYLASTGISKLGWRQFRRSIYYELSGHANRCHQYIQPNWRRGLWLYKGIPQIGDALMDLAPRSLLVEHGIKVDLFSDSHICELFKNDSWFGKNFSELDRVQAKDYDFVIVPSNKRRSLSHKRGPLAKLPWISMHGFYTGPEFDRGGFSAQRVFDALRITGTQEKLQSHARQKLSPIISPASVGRNPGGMPIKLAFALGGVDPQRTYDQWQSVAQGIAAHRLVDVTLLGSSNAAQAAREFQSKWLYSLNNQVGQTSLFQCREIIHQQDLFFACDGGLMHLGVTTPTRLVSLFSRSVHPAWRLPLEEQRNSLQATGYSFDGSVNAIHVDEIVATAERLLAPVS